MNARRTNRLPWWLWAGLVLACATGVVFAKGVRKQDAAAERAFESVRLEAKRDARAPRMRGRVSSGGESRPAATGSGGGGRSSGP